VADKIKFEFTMNEANAILGNLGKLPYEQVFPLIDSIRTQALPQVDEINKQLAEEAKQAEEAKASEENNGE